MQVIYILISGSKCEVSPIKKVDLGEINFIWPSEAALKALEDAEIQHCW